MDLTRRELLAGFAGAVAYKVIAPLQAVSAPLMSELEKKAARGNAELITEKDIVVKRELVEVAGERFTVLLFEKKGPSAQKFFVPHDNELAAFDTALRFIGEHGGTLVTFDSGGQRNLKTERGQQIAQDPNRMFEESARYWPLAKHVVELVTEKDRPVVTLHNNGPIGSFVNSLNNPSREGLTLSLVNKETRRDIVWIAGKEHLADSSSTQRIMGALNERGVNCLYERVDGVNRSDGSLSQYCARKGIPYFNVEVGLQGPSDTHIAHARERQAPILLALMEVLKNQS